MDVLIVTAIKEEFDAVLEVKTGVKEGRPWRRPDGFDREGTQVQEFEAENGGTLRMVVTLASDQGEPMAVNAATRLFTHAAIGKPRCLAMCGVCAGPASDVALGDVVFANRVWDYEAGKVKVDLAKDKTRTEQVFHDLNTFRLKPPWDQDVRFFKLGDVHSWRKDRPIPLSWQADWFLRELLHERQPADHVAWKTYCPEYAKTAERLRERVYIVDRHVGFDLTPLGRDWIEAKLNTSPERTLPEPPKFGIHVGPIVSGSRVVNDPQIFEEIRRSERSVRALEREAYAIGATADAHEIPYMLVVKGVMDHATAEKDDQFKTFAARASAECLIGFLRRYMPTVGPRVPEILVRNDPAAFETDRRSFLAFVNAMALGAIAGSVVVRDHTVDVVHRKTPSTPPLPTRAPRLFRAALSPDSRERSFLLPAEDNPTRRLGQSPESEDPYEVFTHTTLASARAFAGASGLFGDEVRRVNELIRVHQARGNLVTFGSPTSNRTARIGMRYAEIEGMGARVATTSGVRRARSEDSLQAFQRQSHPVLGRGSSPLAENRRWQGDGDPQLGYLDGGATHLLPRRGGRANSFQDYLLISSLPNAFHPESLDCGLPGLLNFGGTHREGM